MDEQKLTPWFPKNVKPARAGCYQVGFYSSVSAQVEPYPFSYHWFNGKKWADDAWRIPTDGSRVRAAAGLMNMYRSAFWRGLTKEPK